MYLAVYKIRWFRWLRIVSSRCCRVFLSTILPQPDFPFCSSPHFIFLCIILTTATWESALDWQLSSSKSTTPTIQGKLTFFGGDRYKWPKVLENISGLCIIMQMSMKECEVVGRKCYIKQSMQTIQKRGIWADFKVKTGNQAKSGGVGDNSVAREWWAPRPWAGKEGGESRKAGCMVGCKGWEGLMMKVPKGHNEEQGLIVRRVGHHRVASGPKRT